MRSRTQTESEFGLIGTFPVVSIGNYLIPALSVEGWHFRQTLFKMARSNLLGFDANTGQFVGPGGSVTTEPDELTSEPKYEHPLRLHYEGYTASYELPRDAVYVPYNEGIPVLDSRDVLERLHAAGKAVPRFRLAGSRRFYRLDPSRSKIGILAAGGVAPGLNCVIDSIVKRHSLLATKGGDRDPSNHLEIVGYIGGFRGLKDGNFRNLFHKETDRHSLEAGNLLQYIHEEVPGAADPNFEARSTLMAEEAARAITRDALDVLYVIGGDGTLGAADRIVAALGRLFGKAGQKVRVVGAPKTMDDDVGFADVTFGVRTAVENAVECIRRIHFEAESQRCLGIVELIGDREGFVALHAAYASGDTDFVLVPEMYGPRKQLKGMQLDRMTECLGDRLRKKHHALLVVAEGASADPVVQGGEAGKEEAYGAFVADLTARLRQQGLNSAFVEGRPKGLIRNTPPNAFDIDLCKHTGKLMVDAALAGFGGCSVQLWHNRFCLVPFQFAAWGIRKTAIEDYYFLSMSEKNLLSVAKASPAPVPW